MAMDPRKYEPLRDAHRLALEQTPEKREQPERDNAGSSSERKTADPEREGIQAQARREVELEKAKRYEWQKAGYDQRQRDEAAKQERDAKSLEYMRVNDPKEYARQVRDTNDRAEWTARDRQVRSEAQERVARGPEREKGDAAQGRDTNKWRSEMSDQTRANVDQAKQRDAQERERQQRER